MEEVCRFHHHVNITYEGSTTSEVANPFALRGNSQGGGFNDVPSQYNPGIKNNRKKTIIGLS
jgi:hypothetical protein